MNATTTRLYSLQLSNIKSYLIAFIFVIGNLIFPQLCHLVPSGGLMFLPIYFFTLVAAYKYGIHVGLLTAIFSPLLNYFIFGMPPLAVLPIILIKSILLASTAALVAHRMRKISILSLLSVVLVYQVVGTFVEWMIVGDFFVAVQDFRIGIPGMIIQIIGGYFVLKLMTKY